MPNQECSLMNFFRNLKALKVRFTELLSPSASCSLTHTQSLRTLLHVDALTRLHPPKGEHMSELQESDLGKVLRLHNVCQRDGRVGCGPVG